MQFASYKRAFFVCLFWDREFALFHIKDLHGDLASCVCVFYVLALFDL